MKGSVFNDKFINSCEPACNIIQIMRGSATSIDNQFFGISIYSVNIFACLFVVCVKFSRDLSDVALKHFNIHVHMIYTLI